MNLFLVLFLIYSIVCCLLYILALRGNVVVDSFHGEKDEKLMVAVFVFLWPIWAVFVIYRTIRDLLKGDNHG